MIFLLEEEIDDFNTFKSWFTSEAIPQIEAVGGKCLVMGVDVENKNCLSERRRLQPSTQCTCTCSLGARKRSVSRLFLSNLTE